MKNQLLNLLKTANDLMSGGEFLKALQLLESAPGFDPEPWLGIEIYFQMALCRCELGDHTEAAADLETALSLAGDADYSEKKHIYDILLIAYTNKPDYEKLAELCRMLIGIEEDKTRLVLSLIYAYFGSEKWGDLAQVFDDYHDIELNDKTLMCKIICFKNTGRYKGALKAAFQYIESSGDNHEIFRMMSYFYYKTGEGETGFEYYKKAIALCGDPEWRLNIGSQLLWTDLYEGAVGDGEFQDVVNNISLSTEKLLTNTVFNNTLKPFRKIRIGYLSADLRRHPVGYFLLPVMKNTDPGHCFNICFDLNDPDYGCTDPVTRQFKSLADGWEEVYERPDSYIEQLFLNNKIDIAFDMMGHTANNRLPLYARRLAPLQVSWIGSPVTSGVAAMDYVITDKNTDPPGAGKYYAEKLLYMPECFLCTALSDSPPVEPPAVTRNGYITFACFHNLQKLTDKTINMWRRILAKCRDSRLKIIGMAESEELREIVKERVIKNGLPMERVSILPPVTIGNDYFTAYNDVDIMLDTYPFCGATTTFDALRMGRPIITLVGERHVSRVSYSLLKHVGLEDLAAFSEDEYVEKAIALACDNERLIKINAELPRRVEDSPLVSQPAFRKSFEKIIRDVWVGYCFDNRMADYNYGADSPQELLEQVVNATVYLKSRLDAGESIDNALVTEYHRAQKAFCEKLNLVTNDQEFVREYEKLVGMIENSPDIDDLSLDISTVKRLLNNF